MFFHREGEQGVFLFKKKKKKKRRKLKHVTCTLLNFEISVIISCYHTNTCMEAIIIHVNSGLFDSSD